MSDRRRIPTPQQAALAAERAADVMEGLAKRGAPLPRCLEIGPIRMEFGADPADNAPAPESAEEKTWQGRPFA